MSDYKTSSKRVRDKVNSSWNQINKLVEKKFDADFPLEYWEDNDKWIIDMKNELVKVSTN